MTETARLKLPVIAAAQAQKHVTHNEALAVLDTFVQLTVESRTVAAPPGSPAEGECYIVPAGATGAWSGWELSVAALSGGGWVRLDPPLGTRAYVKDERVCVVFADDIWRSGVAFSAHGGRLALRAKEEELTLSGAFVETTDVAFIPDRAIVLGVSSRTTQAIAGATSYGVGVSGDATKFGALLGISLGATNIGVIGPTAYYADTRVRVTANGSNFTCGKVRLIVYFMELSAPGS
jgi:hypothetical protein